MTRINALRGIIKQNGSCAGIICNNCPFSEYYSDGNYFACDPEKIRLLAARYIALKWDSEPIEPIDFACIEMMCEREEK